MKALLTTIVAICAFTLTSKAQWYTGGTGPNTYLLPAYTNVGIGTTSPSAKLQVTNTDATTGANTLIVENTGATGNEAALLFKGGYTTASLASGRIYSLYDGGTSYANARTTIQSLTSGGVYNNTFNVKNNMVGIGTTNPDQALTVNGQVHSTSVVVTSTVPAPDYVFNNDYNLRPLADVKTFVDQNHHLPEVPSAADFKKDGQNLGEMNMTLLKKVEELTLYMIDLNKTVKAQQGEIKRLKNPRR